MPPTTAHIASQIAISFLLLGTIWLPLGAFLLWLLFHPWYVAIREKGFRPAGAVIDLFPDSYKRLKRSIISSLKLKNTTDCTVQIYLNHNNDPLILQFLAKTLLFSGITLEAGQKSKLEFPFHGDYDLVVRRLDGLAMPYDHLAVHVTDNTEKVAITEHGFRVGKTLADLQPESPNSSARYSLKAGSSVPFRNCAQYPVQIYLYEDGNSKLPATGPQELQRPGLLLDPGQDREIKFSNSGDYNVAVYRLDRQHFKNPSCYSLFVHVEEDND